MKTMLRKGLYLLGCWLFSSTFTAQNASVLTVTPEELAQNQTETMTADLALSREQQAKIKEINLHYAKKMHGSEKEASEWLQNFQAKVAELKGVLTGEQYETWQAKRANLSKLAKESLMIVSTSSAETNL